MLGLHDLNTDQVLAPLWIRSLESGAIFELDVAGGPALVTTGSPTVAAEAGIPLGGDGLGIVAPGAEPEAFP